MWELKVYVRMVVWELKVYVRMVVWELKGVSEDGSVGT